MPELSDRERLLIATLNPAVVGPELVAVVQRVTGVEPMTPSTASHAAPTTPPEGLTRFEALVLLKLVARCTQYTEACIKRDFPDGLPSDKPKPAAPTKKLSELLNKARAAYNAMTPEQKAAHDEAQRASWVRGELALGESARVTKLEPLGVAFATRPGK